MKPLLTPRQNAAVSWFNMGMTVVLIAIAAACQNWATAAAWTCCLLTELRCRLRHHAADGGGGQVAGVFVAFRATFARSPDNLRRLDCLTLRYCFAVLALAQRFNKLSIKLHTHVGRVSAPLITPQDNART